MVDQNLRQKRIWVKGLIIDCPVGISLENCPAKDSRLLSIDEQFELVDLLDESQLDKVISYHRKCMNERE